MRTAVPFRNWATQTVQSSIRSNSAVCSSVATFRLLLEPRSLLVDVPVNGRELLGEPVPIVQPEQVAGRKIPEAFAAVLSEGHLDLAAHLVGVRLYHLGGVHHPPVSR